MKQLLLIAGVVMVWTMTSELGLAAEQAGTVRVVQERGPISQARQVAVGQFSSQPIQGTGPVSRVLELNRRKNDFIIRNVFGR